VNALADSKVQLQVNMLINWVLPDVEPRCERVVAIDGVNQSAFCIDLESDRALPVLRTFHEILIAIAEGSAIILARDPYSDLLRNDDDFSQAERSLRDRAWRAIRDLLYAAGDDIYFGRERGHHIRLQAGKWGVTRETIYCWLRRYWQRGMTPNALLGDFKNSGRVGPRPAKGPDAPKRGRRSIEEIQIEKETGAAVRKGINMTSEDIAKCRQGIKEFYLKREGYSLSQAYIKTMAKYYIVGHIIDGKNLKPVAAPADERPSLAQFRSEYYKNRDRARDLLARKGKAAAITKRSRIGTRFVTQFGPGMEYELDATPGDTVLVHSITREPIGRPTIYRVHDVFSGMIVGICVTLEPPNWTGAMLVIDNVVSDKVAFCKEYGIEISEQHWPSRYLCRHFSADNGSEWKWYASDNIPELLKAQLHNVAPYRGDLKPIVESTHNAIKQMVDRGLPGNMLVKPDRGERDFRKEPILDLRQYTQLQIRAAIDYNLFHLIKQYPVLTR
jgi:putative transposase